MKLSFQTNPVWIIAVFLATQLSVVLGTSHRIFELNAKSNAACLYVNASQEDTSLSIEFSDVTDHEIPLIIFNYNDLIKFKNLPNLNYFVNHTYVFENHIVENNNGSVGFTFELRKGLDELPPSLFNTTIDEDSVIEYPIADEGVYCVYLPIYKSTGEGYLPTTQYKAKVTVNNEAVPANIFQDISTHVSLALMFGVAFVVVAFFHPAVSQRRLSQLPLITRYIIYYLLTNFAYNSIFFALELICAYFPNDPLYDFTEDWYFRLQTGVLNKFQSYIIVLVYLGYGYHKLNVNVISKFTVTLWLINSVSRIFTDYLLRETNTIIDIILIDEKYQVLYNTVLLAGTYKADRVAAWAPRERALTSIFTLVQILTEFLLFIIFLWNSYKINKKLTQLGEPGLKKYITRSLFYHLFLYKIVFKQVALYLSHLKFGGLFDVGETLQVIGHFIEMFEMKLIGFNLLEILIVWYIWGTNKPLKLAPAKKVE
ncbi:uncharacterized protein RJT20DRAFT_1949 [Scheffersomyces xylosifermentans]|uniref:uncharacterized protein n=1 Tax=Scheffersomyces xylosifermentans TaxID=1304137 RepID=UPI00315DDE2F